MIWFSVVLLSVSRPLLFCKFLLFHKIVLLTFKLLADLGALGNYPGSPFLPSDSDILLDSPEPEDIGKAESYLLLKFLHHFPENDKMMLIFLPFFFLLKRND